MEIKEKCLCDYATNSKGSIPNLDYNLYRRCQITSVGQYASLERNDFEFPIPISFCPFCGENLRKKISIKRKKNFKINPLGIIKFKENFANNFEADEWYGYEYIMRDNDKYLLIDNAGLIPLEEVLKVKFKVD